MEKQKPPSLTLTVEEIRKIVDALNPHSKEMKTCIRLTDEAERRLKKKGVHLIL